jgi:hypothetical protein
MARSLHLGITTATLREPTVQSSIAMMGFRPNGLRYPLVGGMRGCHFDGTSFEPSKLLENAASPTSRVYAVLARSLCFESRLALSRPEHVTHPRQAESK